jgi:hypothetical protein
MISISIRHPRERSMPTTPYNLVDALASDAGQLGDTVRHARRIQALDQVFARAAGHPLSTYCRVANLSTDTVILHAQSSTWGTKLRYRLPAILVSLRAVPGYGSLRHAEIRIRPLGHEPTRPVPRRQPLSAASGRLLEDVARATARDDLREALLRLSRHAAKTGR